MTADGPRLIEVNARWHSANFCEICKRSCGAEAISATIDAYFDQAAFAALPDRPLKLRQAGMIFHLVSYAEGRLEAVRHLEEISALPSVLHAEIFSQVGDEVAKTVDIRSDFGYVLLSHVDADCVARDCEIIEKLQRSMLVVDS